MEIILKINSDILRHSQGWEPRKPESSNHSTWKFTWTQTPTFLRKHILEKYLYIENWRIELGIELFIDEQNYMHENVFVWLP